MKRLIVALLTFIFISICFTSIASSIKVWPGKHEITVNKWYNYDEASEHPKISVINTESYDITVTFTIDDPTAASLTNSYSYIPDKSWIKIIPNELVIPAGESKEVEILIDVPEDKQSQNYNERWETWVIVTPPIDKGSGINVRTEVGVKLFIKTPGGDVAVIQPFYIFIIAIIITFFVFVAIFYKEKRKRSATSYYFKKKK